MAFSNLFPFCEDGHGRQNERKAQKAPCDKVRSTLKQMGHIAEAPPAAPPPTPVSTTKPQASPRGRSLSARRARNAAPARGSRPDAAAAGMPLAHAAPTPREMLIGVPQVQMARAPQAAPVGMRRAPAPNLRRHLTVPLEMPQASMVPIPRQRRWGHRRRRWRQLQGHTKCQ